MNPPLVAKLIVIGHRGACAYRPEHTLASYQLAIDLGAGFIEPDLVPTRDGVLVARHENELSGSTDVVAHPEFANRRTRKVIDGRTVEGWFSEDFTLAELKTLRAREAIPQLRPSSATYDGQFEIPTLQEIIDLVRANEARRPAGSPRIGIYPETKHPSYFSAIGLALEGPLLHTLTSNGYGGHDAPIFIQSFEVENLRGLATRTELPLIQLLSATGQPYDFVVAGDRRTYADLLSPLALAEVAGYAAGIGVQKELIIPRDPSNNLEHPTTLIEDAHAAGLLVHAWTFRSENYFLSHEFRKGEDVRATGDLFGELSLFLDLGLEGFFTDNADIGVHALEARRTLK